MPHLEVGGQHLGDSLQCTLRVQCYRRLLFHTRSRAFVVVSVLNRGHQDNDIGLKPMTEFSELQSLPNRAPRIFNRSGAVIVPEFTAKSTRSVKSPSDS